MKEPFRIFALVVVLVAALASTACAQYQVSDKSRFGIGLSLYSPSNSNVSSLGSTWYAPVLDFHLAYDKDDRPTALVSLGWFSASGVSPLGITASATLVPVTATYIKRFSKSADRSFYVGGGPGLYFGNYKSSDGFGEVSTNQTAVGLNLLTGYEFGSWFAQLRYDKAASMTNQSVNGSVDFSGVSFVIGSRLAL